MREAAPAAAPAAPAAAVAGAALAALLALLAIARFPLHPSRGALDLAPAGIAILGAVGAASAVIWLRHAAGWAALWPHRSLGSSKPSDVAVSARQRAEDGRERRGEPTAAQLSTPRPACVEAFCWGSPPSAALGGEDIAATNGCSVPLGEGLGAQPPAAVAVYGHRVLLADAAGHLFEAATGTLRPLLATQRALCGVRVQHVACSARHAAAVSAAGAVFTWGSDSHGQLGQATEPTAEPLPDGVDAPRRVAALAGVRVRRAACGARHTLLATTNGLLYSCGDGTCGQLGHRDRPKMLACPRRVHAVPVHGKAGAVRERRIVDVAAGDTHSLALDAEGGVLGFGSRVAACGASPAVVSGAMASPRGAEDDAAGAQAVPEALRALRALRPRERFVRVFCGARYSAALAASGAVVTWGHGTFGELGRPGTAAPARVPLPRVETLACGAHHAAALVEGGRVLAWGRMSARWHSTSPRALAAPPPASEGSGAALLACGGSFTLLLRGPLRAPGTPTGPPLAEIVPDGDAVRAEQRLERKWREALRALDWRSGAPPPGKLWRRGGVPAALRGEVWPRMLGNGLRLSKATYDALLARRQRCGCDAAAVALIEADLPRTFPTLGLFGARAPLGMPLLRMLDALASLRPETGYVQGMSYLGALLLLHVEPEWRAFQCLGNLVLREHLFAFFRLERDLVFSYYELFERALEANARRAADHLRKCGCAPHLYLFGWLQTLFAKVLPVATAERLLDCFLAEGSRVVLRAAVAVVQIFQTRLLAAGFEGCSKLLSASPGQEAVWAEEVTEEALFKAMDEVRLPAKVLQGLQDNVNM